jgi:hypothetical protein
VALRGLWGKGTLAVIFIQRLVSVMAGVVVVLELLDLMAYKVLHLGLVEVGQVLHQPSMARSQLTLVVAVLVNIQAQPGREVSAAGVLAAMLRL